MKETSEAHLVKIKPFNLFRYFCEVSIKIIVGQR